jgi:hypothetical protein
MKMNQYYSRMKINVLVSFLILIIGLSGCSGHKKIISANPENLSILSYRNASVARVPVKTKAEWILARAQILDSMQQAMGELPDFKNLPDFNLLLTDSIQETNYKRYSITFTVAQNENLTAYLYIPSGIDKAKRNPAMMALHETDPIGKESVDGQGSNKNLGYAKELAERGYIVIAPDYPSFGDMKEYDFDHDRYQSGTMKGIFDHMRCVDLLQSLSYVDPERIGVIGHSLGGHNSIFVGAFDNRLKVVVSSCGWTGFAYYDVGEKAIQKYGGRLGPWAIPRYMPLLREKYGLDNNKIPFDFDEIISSIAPRAFFSNSPVQDENFAIAGVKAGIKNISVVYNFLGVPGNLQVYYPEAKHDFPPEVRLKAYQFIDKILQHASK